jgi:peptidoglycan/xylan/chitin deacetylase (PgdA/CDA1 family)
MEAMDAAQYPVILTYHSISEGNSPLKTSPALFVEQMEWLRANVRVSPLREIVSALSERRALPERTVVLTFDDGFRDFYAAAAPVLCRLQLPAIVFLPTGHCGKTNRWPGQAASVAEEALLDWKQVAELARQGFCFGAHSISHAVLTELPADLAEREIVGSKAAIEENTRQPVEFFAYPEGRWNPVVRQLARQYYRAACSTAAAVVEPRADLFALPRADAHYFRHPARFRELFTNRFLAYLTTRRLIRRIRRKPEGFYSKV